LGVLHCSGSNSASTSVLVLIRAYSSSFVVELQFSGSESVKSAVSVYQKEYARKKCAKSNRNKNGIGDQLRILLNAWLANSTSHEVS
jgi:hypothetical protein